ncbi:MAG: tRNA 2-selenouridine(34) synthase MnmH [Rubrivivax sp.]|nr:tRNA 2-selenouridine(34) synthase MnmH [Rubrivivax sp.]
MSVLRIAAAEAIARLDSFERIIDARSESEFADDHLPGAVNWPVLTDAERARIGTAYKQVSPFDARKQGAVLVARNIASHIERELHEQGRAWRPLVYCWRGGQRSGALATVLDAIGFRVQVLEGGYRAFRRAVRDELETLPLRLALRVLAGRTGSGKSRLLAALVFAGAQVLDLEALAAHRGSVLGALPGRLQPTQKAFETALWHALRGFDPARPVWVESESRTIGRLRVPEALLARMRAAPCSVVDMAPAARVALLLEDYGHFVRDSESFCERLAALRELRGAAAVARWQALARAGGHAAVVRELLEQHYDPIYLQSMARNFAGFGAAARVPLTDGSAAALRAAARALMQAGDVTADAADATGGARP